MSRQKGMLQIVGDIDVKTDISVSTKGGSLNATLKKEIRERLGKFEGHLTAAALQFSDDQAVVLLCGGSGASAASSLRVRRISKNRFELELDTGDHEEIDDITAAFLMLKIEQFKRSKLDLLPAVTAEDWQEEMDEKFKAAEAATKTLPVAD